jgi:hypothetical protein
MSTLFIIIVLSSCYSSYGLTITPTAQGSAPLNDKCQEASLVELGNSYEGSNSFSTVDFGGLDVDQCVIPYFSGLVWYKVVGRSKNLVKDVNLLRKWKET